MTTRSATKKMSASTSKNRTSVKSRSRFLKPRAPRKPTKSKTLPKIHMKSEKIARGGFALFAKLPAELQLMIFKHALPTSDNRRNKILRVTANPIPANRRRSNKALRFSIDYTSPDGNLCKAWIPHPSLSMACKASRSIFLENFKSFLPTNKGIVRFDDTIIVHITNFGHLARHPTFLKMATTSAEERSPCCLDTISKLAGSAYQLRAYPVSRQPGGYRFSLPPDQLFSPFSNLTQLFGVLRQNYFHPNRPGIEPLFNLIKAEMLSLEDRLGVKVSFANLEGDESMEIY